MTTTTVNIVTTNTTTMNIAGTTAGRRTTVRQLTDRDADGHRYAAPFRVRRRSVALAIG